MLLFHRRRAGSWCAVLCFLSILSMATVTNSLSAKPPKAKASKTKKKGGGAARPGASASPDQLSLTNIPLPIGHEAKGLVFPDFDAQGHLVGKFEAGTAKRIDQDHVRFENLKITTFTPENTADLEVNMHTSVLNLQTHVLASDERSTIKRTDFNIVGDTVQFDTSARTTRMIGNVKMVISSQSSLIAKPNE